MAEPHAHSQPIQTYGPAPHNRNIWPHNSQAAPSRLADSFVLIVPVYPLLTTFGINSKNGVFYIGNSPISIQSNDVTVGDKTYAGTPGLWELLTMANPNETIYDSD